MTLARSYDDGLDGLFKVCEVRSTRRPDQPGRSRTVTGATHGIPTNKEFETCALALLGDIYPGLSPVEGGRDFGRDGDIYFLLEPGRDLSRRGRLLATIGDPMTNVRTGLRRMQEEHQRIDLLVLATSQPLSARQRANIERLAAQYEVPVTEFYARDWLAAKLWRYPLWRKRLLGITGELSALVPRPLSLLEHSDTLTELVGRGTEQQELRDLVDDHRDVIVAGASGCGKTRLCAELGDRVLFLERGEPHRVADDVREHRPTAVVIDDARGRGQQIELLRRIRVEENQRFSVIAVTWRAELEDIQRDLPGAAIVVLRRRRNSWSMQRVASWFQMRFTGCWTSRSGMTVRCTAILITRCACWVMSLAASILTTGPPTTGRPSLPGL